MKPIFHAAQAPRRLVVPITGFAIETFEVRVRPSGPGPSGRAAARVRGMKFRSASAVTARRDGLALPAGDCGAVGRMIGGAPAGEGVS